MIFEIFKDSKKQFRFRMRAKNGRIVAQSEGYKAKRNAHKLIKSLKNLILDGNPDAIQIRDLTI